MVERREFSGKIPGIGSEPLSYYLRWLSPFRRFSSRECRSFSSGRSDIFCVFAGDKGLVDKLVSISVEGASPFMLEGEIFAEG